MRSVLDMFPFTGYPAGQSFPVAGPATLAGAPAAVVVTTPPERVVVVVVAVVVVTMIVAPARVVAVLVDDGAEGRVVDTVVAPTEASLAAVLSPPHPIRARLAAIDAASTKAERRSRSIAHVRTSVGRPFR